MVEANVPETLEPIYKDHDLMEDLTTAEESKTETDNSEAPLTVGKKITVEDV